MKKLLKRLTGKSQYKKMNKVIKQGIKNNHNVFYFIDCKEKHRGIGKSYNLVKLAIEYSLPVLVPNRQHERNLQAIAAKYFGVKIRTITLTKESKRRIQARKFLVEVEVDVKLLSELVGENAASLVLGYR